MTDTLHPEPELLRSLLTTPPAEFVAERNRVVKQLRADGEREVAKVVSGLRRPNVVDWALNVVAGEHPDEIHVFADAADEVQDAQTAAMEGRPGADVRSAMRELREQTAHVVALVGDVTARLERPGAAAAPGSVTARLTDIAGSPAACGLLRSGLLGAEDTGGVDPFAGGSPPVGRTEHEVSSAEREASQPETGTAGSSVAPAEASTARRSTAEERREAEARARERRAHMRALADAQRVHAAASQRLTDADRDVARHESAVSKVQAQVDDAQARLDAAQVKLREANEDLATVRQRRDEVATEADAARARVADAQRAVDGDQDVADEP